MAEVKRQKEGGYDKFSLSGFEMPESIQAHLSDSVAPSQTGNRKRSRPFIKGPIDLEWVQKACCVNASTLAFYLQYMRGILGADSKIQVRPTDCRKFGIADKARQRQIDSLEKAGLIVADRGKGRCPRVQVIFTNTD